VHHDPTKPWILNTLNPQDLVGKAKGGGLRPDEFQSGTFTISNLGMFGVSSFGSLLPPGNGAILAVAGANPTVVMKNGQPSEVKMMEVTLTADHRHIYGADSALFLKVCPCTINPRPQNLDPTRTFATFSTLNPQPSTLNPKP
jgi:pyruvate dehydrogenase E2 component (dihydrolipoamide acetyltransferase)